MKKPEQRDPESLRSGDKVTESHVEETGDEERNEETEDDIERKEDGEGESLEKMGEFGTMGRSW